MAATPHDTPEKLNALQLGIKNLFEDLLSNVNQTTKEKHETAWKERMRKLIEEAESSGESAINTEAIKRSLLSNKNLINNNNKNYSIKDHRLTRAASFAENRSGAPLEVIKCSDPSVKEEVVIETKEIQERYKFFECYQNNINNGHGKENGGDLNGFKENGDAVDFAGQPRVEIVPDANIVVSNNEMNSEIPKIDTTSKMLNKFKQLETQMSLESNISPTKKPIGGTPKPLKRITPPREFTKDVIENEPEVERDPNIVKSSYKTEDVIPVEPKLARSLTAKFENWFQVEEKENKRNSIISNPEEDDLPAKEMAKNLVAKFESIRDDSPAKPVEKAKPRVNRFVNESNGSEDCSVCGKRLYPMEKVESSEMKMHKNCFKCSHCLSSLRLENYTLAAGKFYCIVHFKQLFMAKGNYDEGFGVEQHKEKWRNRSNASPTISSRNESPDSVELDYCEDDADSTEDNHYDQVTA